MEAGEFAEVMFTRMMAYAGRHREWNGHLPRTVVLSRLGLVALESAPESAPESRLEALLESGLISAQGPHIIINGWLKWNEAGEQVEQSREQDRERKSAVARSDGRADPESAPESAPEVAPESGTTSGAQEEIRREEKKKEQAALRADFEDWYQTYPRKVAKPAAAKAYAKARRSTNPLVLLVGAQAMAKAFAYDKTYCPNPATWLNQERWNDEQPTNGKAKTDALGFLIP